MRLFSSVLLCSASLAGLSAPAMAQGTAPAAEEGAVSGDVIIVQARRRDEAVQDVPAVIDTVTADDVAKLNFRDFKEVASIVPGLQLTTEANGTGGNARLRGVNFDITASGSNPTVEFYFNDAPITAGAILQQMYDIGQIEVQRGPQGTLRGRAAPSGSITIGAKKPDLYELGGFTDMTANDIGTVNFKGGLNLPVIEGVAAIRVAGVWDENEGDRVRPITAGRDPFSRTKSGRVSALVQPTDWLKLEGLYQYMDRRAFTYDQVASFSEANPDAAASPVYVSTADRRSIQETAREIHQVYEIFNWRAEASAMGQVLIYQGQHNTQKISAPENQDFGNFFPGDVEQLTYSHPAWTSHEIRLQNDARIADIFDYVVGYFNYKTSQPTELTRPTIIGFPTSANTGQIATVLQTAVGRVGDSREKSFFGNLTAHIGASTEISGGVRRISYQSENALYVNGALTDTQGQDAKKWIYSASVKQNFTPDFMIYASTGSSWRPGINVVGDFSQRQSALESSFINLPAETSKSYEVGFKSTMMGGRLRANATAYHQKFTNYPYRVGGRGIYFVDYTNPANPVVSQFNFVGAVPVEVNGIEGDVSFDVVRGLSVSAVASYSMGKIKGGVIPCNDLNRDGIPDATTNAPTLGQLQAATDANNLAACAVSQRSGFQSPFSASLTSEYNFAISNHANAYLRGLLNFAGTSRVDPNNVYDDIGSYGLVNLYAGIRDSKGAWEVSLFAKNLFDTTKTLSRSDPLFTSYRNAAGGFAATTYTSTYTAVTSTAPREFGINVRYAFGSR
ncbi:TonB-denpendent receptor [Novosphingobium barchaimii LL02]|uniref:TonB-denpendent receptor n=1 Tax=Novosphingobium barchaimii LL02 TaxID=1114963 RepID=A0A0J7XH60_9SPHN|nr:TonB-dependent receptor plug domain-containing protein [Novosphingobium barchaimii]KMS51102.1 TonB-denpendent receptor [Novosphingobium barchaimii LL02]